MFKLSKSLVVSAGLASALMLGMVGCSVSSESTTTTEVSTTDEDGKTTTTTTESSSSVSSDEGASSQSTTTTSTSIDVDNWEDAWMGESEKGMQVLYAQAPQGTNQALIVVYDANANNLVSVVGNYEVPEDGIVVVTDAGNTDMTFRFGVVAQDEKSVELDLGDDFGTANLAACSMEDLLAKGHEIDPDGKVFV